MAFDLTTVPCRVLLRQSGKFCGWFEATPLPRKTLLVPAHEECVEVELLAMYQCP